MTDYETIKSIFSKASWDIKETIINQNNSDPTLKKLSLGGYYGIDVFFEENGDICIE